MKNKIIPTIYYISSFTQMKFCMMDLEHLIYNSSEIVWEQ